MDINIEYRPVNSLAEIQLEPNEQMIAEPGAMVGMSTNVNMDTGMSGSQNNDGGFLSKMAGAASKMLSGESFFQNTFTAQGGPGEVLLSHTLTGDMFVTEVPQQGLMIQSKSYIASSPGVDISTNVGGFKTFFAGEGLFVMKASATGAGQQLLCGAFGGIDEMQVDGSMVIDTGHLVAWDGNLDFDLERSGGGLIGSMLSGEGLVCHFKGQGRVWMQTRNPVDYGETMGRRLPPRQR